MESYSKAAMGGDEGTKSDSAGHGEEDYLVAGGAQIHGIINRSMRRRRERLEELGHDGLFDRRRGWPSSKRVPLATVEQVLGTVSRSLIRSQHAAFS
jgi:hypothetical protein